MIQKKSENGITLIALVVTIVVLLILAGITINLVFSEDGIISKARLAAERTEEGEINDQESINQLSNDLEDYINDLKRKDYSVVSLDRYNCRFILQDNTTNERIFFGDRVVVEYDERGIVFDNNLDEITNFLNLFDLPNLSGYNGYGKVTIYKDEIPYEWEGIINTIPN